MTAQASAEISTSESIVGVVNGADAATLGFLKAIDSTVEAMCGIEKIMSGFTSVVEAARESVEAKPVVLDQYIDADDKAIDATMSLASNLKDFLTMLVSKRSAIDKDNRLKEDHSEALHDAYGPAIDAVAELIETVDDLRRAIIKHDLAAEPRDGVVCESVDELITSLRSDV